LQAISSSLYGKINRIFCSIGSTINKGEVLLTLDAMKIENKIVSASEGKVVDIKVREGEQVQSGQVLIIIDSFNTESQTNLNID
jgi:biotin carboxyl carrier protein